MKIISLAWGFIDMLFWFALRVNWSGISKFLGADKNQSFLILQLPFIVFVVIVLLVVFEFILCFKKTKKLPVFICLALNLVFTIAEIVVIIFGSIDYIQFILPKFFKSCVVSIALLIIALLLRKTKLAKSLKIIILSILIVACIFFGYQIRIGNRFTYKSVVYAVEDTYQIVFSTSAKSIGWVEIDGKRYNDLFAGSMQSEDLVHKIEVPQEVLDAAKSYSIHAKKVLYRGPFGGYLGKEISEAYSFKPVDTSDGLVYYNLSDVHSAIKGASKTASFVENLDFITILGDTVSMIDRYSDVQLANKLAHLITKGEIPVVYARGNHEIKGKYAQELYKYVGSKNQEFFYDFKLSDVYGIVLDIGEDHDDSWWEYYGTADFVTYQEKQTKMLQQIINQKKAEGAKYTLVACHIPIVFVNARHNHEQVKHTWTSLLNQIQPDLAVYGHQHDLYPFFENSITHDDKGRLVYNSQFRKGTYAGYVTEPQFNSFIVGRRGTTQTDEPSSFDLINHIGLVTKVNLEEGTQISYYINSKGEKLSVFNPFVEGPSQTEFITKLK